MEKNSGQFLIIGHRGLREKYIENTMESFIAAESENIDAVELDVQLSKDGKIIVFHDYDASRLLGKDGKVYDLRYDELERLPINGSNETIPTLDEVLGKTKKLALFVELKTIDDDFQEVNAGLEPLVIDALRRSGRRNFFLISFNPKSLIRIKKIDKSIPTGLLIDKDTLPLHKDINREYLRELGSRLILPSFEFISERWVESLRNENFEVFFWNVFDLDQAKAAKAFGSRGIITDFPLAIREGMA